MRLADALPRRPDAPPYVVPYLLVDRRRRSQWRRVVRAVRDGGASAVELGFPFSDPIADGPVLAAAGQGALRAGTGWSDLVDAVRDAAEVIPTAVMTYANPLFGRGLARSVGELAAAGAGGLIVPDLSWDDSAPWRRAAERAGLDLVQFAAPGASARRVARVARDARGFLYLVSRYGTTGRGAAAPRSPLAPIVAAAHRARPDLAVLVGFGIRDRAGARRALESGADGVVVGTALEEQLEREVTPEALGRWLRRIGPARRSGDAPERTPARSPGPAPRRPDRTAAPAAAASDGAVTGSDEAGRAAGA